MIKEKQSLKDLEIAVEELKRQIEIVDSLDSYMLEGYTCIEEFLLQEYGITINEVE